MRCTNEGQYLFGFEGFDQALQLRLSQWEGEMYPAVGGLHLYGIWVTQSQQSVVFFLQGFGVCKSRTLCTGTKLYIRVSLPDLGKDEISKNGQFEKFANFE